MMQHSAVTVAYGEPHHGDQLDYLTNCPPTRTGRENTHRARTTSQRQRSQTKSSPRTAPASISTWPSGRWMRLTGSHNKRHDIRNLIFSTVLQWRNIPSATDILDLESCQCLAILEDHSATT